jgi:hypothetical protein
MYQGNGPVYCNQLWGTTLKRYKQDPAVNEAEIHESHMKRLTNQLA